MREDVACERGLADAGTTRVKRMTKSRVMVAAAIAVFMVAADGSAQTATTLSRTTDNASKGMSKGRSTQSSAEDAQRPTSTPYAGDLSIFEYPDRDKKLQIDRVMDLLGIAPGKNVADIGAGSGWFTVRAARRVGAGGRVFAEDINPLAIEAIGNRASKEQLPNVKTVLGTADNLRLPEGSVDAVLMLKVYHEIARPVELMTELKKALRPGAKVGIIDRNGNGTDHGLKRDVLEKEMEKAGYKVVARNDFTKADGQDYFLIFEVR
jgi:SAM-dependent methyltransferase